MPVDPVFAFLVFSLPQHEIFSVSVAFGFDETNTSLLMPDLHEVSKVPVQIIWLINFHASNASIVSYVGVHGAFVFLLMFMYGFVCVFCACCVLQCQRHVALNACVCSCTVVCVYVWVSVCVCMCVCILDLLISCGADRGLHVPDKKESSELGTGCRDVVHTECRQTHLHIYIQYTVCACI